MQQFSAKKASRHSERRAACRTHKGEERERIGIFRGCGPSGFVQRFVRRGKRREGEVRRFRIRNRFEDISFATCRFALHSKALSGRKSVAAAVFLRVFAFRKSGGAGLPEN